MLISWPDLDLEQSTCFSVSGAENLGFAVNVSGGFGDRVDRVFRFATPDSGDVGGMTPANLTFTWQNRGPGTYGNLGGSFNLANNGGLWTYHGASAPGARWVQKNNGLPMTWLRNNVVALDRGTGDFMVAAFTRGIALESQSGGLYTYNGTNWSRLAPDIFGPSRVISVIAVSKADNNSFAVGTDDGGVYVTTDGGTSFTQWTSELDPGAGSFPTTYGVTAMVWEHGSLFVFMPNWGLFRSTDGGVSFVRSDILVPRDLEVANPPLDLPLIRDIVVDGNNPDHIVVAVMFHGAYESIDGGNTWHDLYGDLVVVDPNSPGAWVHSGLEILLDATDSQIMILAVSQMGLYRTADGGLTWNLVGAAAQPANTARLTSYSLIGRHGLAGEMLAMEDGWQLLHSTDFGQTWSAFAEQPVLNKGLVVVPTLDNSGDFTIGSNGGGTYIPDTVLPLTATYDANTSVELRDLDLGLNISFGSGTAQPHDSFDLIAQTFQGWAVWRGANHDPEHMTLIGLYDRVNPEDCFEGFCGDRSPGIIPRCFRAKRAACFDLSTTDTVRFFDSEIYNGFSYVYAISSFDYGNTALTTSENNTNEMLFSPRWAGDPLSVYQGAGNRIRVDVDNAATAPTATDEIYAFPNPVRLGAGIVGGEGRKVIFTNLPPESRVMVFTTAGDLVADLGPELQTGANTPWQTVNRDGQDVVAGIYLYKVEMPARDPYWGRLVIIR